MGSPAASKDGNTKRKRVKANKNGSNQKPAAATAVRTAPLAPNSTPLRDAPKATMSSSSSSQNPFLFLDEDSDDGDAGANIVAREEDVSDVKFSVNADFAARLAHNKKREELQKLKAKYGNDYDDEEESSGSSEDENAEALTHEIEKDFFSTLAKLKGNKPEIYNPEHSFFKEQEEGDETEDHDKQKHKPMFLKDHERMRLETKGALAFVDDGDDDALGNPKVSSMAFDEEQRKLRSELIASLHGKGDVQKPAEFNDGNGDDDDDFFSVRAKSSTEREAEEADYSAWLKDNPTPMLAAADKEELEPLRRFWTDPNLSETDKFLRDYITKRKWRDDDDNVRGPHTPKYEDIDGRGGATGGTNTDGGVGGAEQYKLAIEDDDEPFEVTEQYERAYNFRFEEGTQAASIATYPRIVDSSMRQKSTKRKEARQRAAERHAEEKLLKTEELKRLKNLKRQEIIEKLEQIKEISGHDLNYLEAVDIEKDFDPEEHDRQMAAAFDDKYYEEADDEKPVFPDMDDDDDEYGDFDEDGDVADDETFYADHTSGGPGGETWGDDDTMPWAPDLDDEGGEDDPASSRGKKRRTKMSRKKLRELEELAANPAKIDEAVAQNPEIKKQLDEFYALDYEDIVGGIPTRFKYREVVPNDFGLTMEEILAAEDKELNKWASLKKVVRYRQREEEEHDRKHYKKRRTDMGRKKEIFAESEAWTKTDKGQKGLELSKTLAADKIKERKQKRMEKRAAKRAQRAQEGESGNQETSGGQGTTEKHDTKLNHHQRRQAERAEKRRQWEVEHSDGESETQEGKKPRKKAKKRHADADADGAEGSQGTADEKDKSGGPSVDSAADVLARKRAKVSAERLAAYRTGSLKLDRQRVKSAHERHDKSGKKGKKDRKVKDKTEKKKSSKTATK